MRFTPHAATALVSCGRENIRFWRIKNGHLPGCSVVLNEYSRGTTFTDLDFESTFGVRPVDGAGHRRVFVANSRGMVAQVNADTRVLECVFRLHDAGICSLSVNEGFCVTGSEDKFLRVWPLDFSDYFLEAQHEGTVTSVDVSSDGLKVCVCV
jgi:WD40 repeat protein